MKVEFTDTRFGGPRSNNVVHAQIEFIKKNLPFSRVVERYHHRWSTDAKTHQFSCHFHGEDQRPSARYYHDTRRMWCFACNEGGDVCWYIKKKEKFESFGQVIEFVKQNYNIWLDPNNLNTRIQMYEPAQVDLREAFSEKHSKSVNDTIYQIQQRMPHLKEKMDGLIPLIWERKAEIDQIPNITYVHYCNMIRDWKLWVSDLIRDANRYGQET